MENVDWSTLKKGDVLHLLVPHTNEHGEIVYEYQESCVISIQITYSSVFTVDAYVKIKFKYIDDAGNKKRVEHLIYPHRIHDPVLIYEEKTNFLNNKNWYGSLVFCYSNPEQLNDFYQKLIEYKTKEIKNLIESQKKLLKKFKNIQNKKIYNEANEKTN